MPAQQPRNNAHHNNRQQQATRNRPAGGGGGRGIGQPGPIRQASSGLVTPHLRQSGPRLAAGNRGRPPQVRRRISRGVDETMPDDETASVQPPSRPTNEPPPAAAARARRGDQRISENNEEAPPQPNRNNESAAMVDGTNDQTQYQSPQERNLRNLLNQQHPHRNHQLEEAPLYQPPQQRERPPPEDRPPARYSSYRSFPSSNPYSVTASESLGRLPTSNRNVKTDCDAYAVETVLYDAASACVDGPSEASQRVGLSGGNDQGEPLASPRRGPSVPGYNTPRKSIITADSEDIYNEEFLDGFDFALFELSELCASSGRLELNADHTEQDSIEHDLSWNPVREWLQRHSPEHIFPYLQARDEYGKAALHFACQHQPPMDIMEYLIQVILDSGNPALLEAQDAFGWTPLHYACAFAAPAAVLQSLAESRNSAKLLTTNKGLTPLHLALIGPIRDAPNIIAILGSNGATRIADQQGLLPVHYACAFGASEESLRVLIGAHPEALVTQDNFGRNPLHFALANTKTNPRAAPVTVRLLLKLRPSLVNPSPDDDGPNPFLFLLEYATQINVSHPGTELRDSIQQCLNLLLDANPHPTPTVFTALRSLPYWLFPTAILSRTVQDLLNEKIKGRFPTIILISDFYVQIMVIVFYQLCVNLALEDRYNYQQQITGRLLQENVPKMEPTVEPRLVAPLFLGAGYFFVREVVQVFSLIYLKSVRTFLRVWILHLSDWLDLSYIALIFLWAFVVMMGGVTDLNLFSTGTAITSSILWAKFFIYLRSVSFDFSVFVSGVFYVAGRLVPYMVGLTFFFVAFTQIFHTMYRSDGDYGCYNSTKFELYGPPVDFPKQKLDPMDLQCEEYDDFLPFCDRWDAFLRVYTMFIGEVDNNDFKSSTVGTVFFSFFMFLMVILLANVLIAIVTDSYKVIQDREATLVFYTNRLYFLAETDAIGNFPCFNLFLSSDGNGGGSKLDERFRQAWEALKFTFELGPDETIGSVQFWKFRFIPIVVAVFIIPLWFLAGALTCGALWPPQLREWLFTVNHNREATIAQKLQEEQSVRREEESVLEARVVETRNDFYHALAENRQQLSQIKAVVAERKQEIWREMKRIKIIMGNLLEQAEQNNEDYDDYDDD